MNVVLHTLLVYSVYYSPFQGRLLIQYMGKHVLFVVFFFFLYFNVHKLVS